MIRYEKPEMERIDFAAMQNIAADDGSDQETGEQSAGDDLS